MSSSYQKFSAEEDKLRGLITDGQYHAFIDSIEITKSKGGLDKNGKPKPILNMIVLDLLVTDINGRDRKLKDWVMLEGEMAWKLRHLADACGLLEEYENDTLTFSMLPGKCPIVDIKTKDGKDQNNNTVKRNSVMDYLKPIATQSANDFQDSEIPF